MAEEVDEDEDEEGEEVEEPPRVATIAAFLAAFFPLVVVDTAGAGCCKSVAPAGMETPTATPFLPAAATTATSRFFFLPFLLLVVGSDAVLLRSATAPFNERAAIPSAAVAIAIASLASSDVRSHDKPEPEPAGVGVASIRGTST